MLLRLAYLGVTNAFALLRLLSMSDRDKDTELLALRHQIVVLQRHLGDARPRFSPADRAFLAALLHRIWNQQHLLYALRQYEHFYNTHRPHQGIASIRPLQPLPQPTTDQAAVTRLDIHRRQRLGGILNEYHHAA